MDDGGGGPSNGTAIMSVCTTALASPGCRNTHHGWAGGCQRQESGDAKGRRAATSMLCHWERMEEVDEVDYAAAEAFLEGEGRVSGLRRRELHELESQLPNRA